MAIPLFHHSVGINVKGQLNTEFHGKSKRNTEYL